jgi:glycosyltransferase involved in cell wall biosynthesis
MTEENYPRDPVTWRMWRWLERQAVRHASLILFTARSAVKMYRQRYTELAAEKCVFLPNGFDEEDFASLDGVKAANGSGAQPFRLLHSGLVYPEERDPRPLFQAVARLKKDGKIAPRALSVDFRAPGFEQQYAKQLRELEIEDVVHLLPRIPYRQALQEYVNCDAFLLMQAKNCDHQIPAKAYEYLRLGKPILALTTESGDTGGLLRECGGTTIVDLADEESIYRELPEFIESVRSERHSRPASELAARYSRRNLAHELARHLDILKERAAEAS